MGGRFRLLVPTPTAGEGLADDGTTSVGAAPKSSISIVFDADEVPVAWPPTLLVVVLLPPLGFRRTTLILRGFTTVPPAPDDAASFGLSPSSDFPSFF